MKITVSLYNKETKQYSKPVDIFDVIYNQHTIEFEFGEYDDDNYGTLPYKDFMFFQDQYDLILNIDGEIKYSYDTRESD